MIIENLRTALKKAVKKAGSQTALAKQSGMSQGQISDYLRGRYDLSCMSVGLIERLFPELKIIFFEDERLDIKELEEELVKQKNKYEARLSELKKDLEILELKYKNLELERQMEELKKETFPQGSKK